MPSYELDTSPSCFLLTYSLESSKIVNWGGGGREGWGVAEGLPSISVA